MAHPTIGIITALTPRIGYAQASAAEQEALATHSSAADVVLAHKLLTLAELDRLLRPAILTGAAEGEHNTHGSPLVNES